MFDKGTQEYICPLERERRRRMEKIT